MKTRTTLSVVLGIAALAASCSQLPERNGAGADGQQPPAAVWSRADASACVQKLSEALSLGTASFQDVLDFTLQALAGVDRADRKVEVDGAVALILRANDGTYLGPLRVLPVTATGVRPMQMDFDTVALRGITDFDAQARAKLELWLGIGTSALDSCDAHSKSEFRANKALLQSITEEKPLAVGGSLQVDRQGASTWRGRVIRYKKDAHNEPPWQEQETEAQPRGQAALSKARAGELRRLLDSLGKP
jgi:hypothetical protein